MSVSTDGILFFGVDIEEGYEVKKILNIDEEEDIYEYIENIIKCNSISNVEIGTYCSDMYLMYYIYAKSFTAFRGSSEEIPIDSLVNFESKELNKLLEILKLDLKPSWRLVSYWG